MDRTGAEPPSQPLLSSKSEEVNDYLALSIIVCLCCCWPLGLAAIVMSGRVREAKLRGDEHGAISASSTTRNLIIASVICGIAILIVLIILLFVVKPQQSN
ncbi:trafficking regulator of GLUT4 1-like [Corticium candelabrum]|uniref:trafficking regulator of GLUT4 1-like n=1 Tax=Corticium candelabrum TaxID=121492 RepID=UPI002E260104|nr:trafficking regulator of GLUT4 1-like [Corticium candelabrum]